MAASARELGGSMVWQGLALVYGVLHRSFTLDSCLRRNDGGGRLLGLIVR